MQFFLFNFKGFVLNLFAIYKCDKCQSILLYIDMFNFQKFVTRCPMIIQQLTKTN